MTKNRCSWCLQNQLYQDYHDNEWGVPVYDNVKHFEMLSLETMQSGLSWITILNRRESLREAFANFDPQIVSMYDERKIEGLMQNKAIIRHRKKIQAVICNAAQFLNIQGFSSFNEYIWSFTDGVAVKNNWRTIDEMPVSTPLSDIISKDMRQRRFQFLGTITVYAYMQAIGIVNDHLLSCFTRDPHDSTICVV